MKSEASWTSFSLSCQHSRELLYRISSAVLYPFVNSFWTWRRALLERSFKTRTTSFTLASSYLASLNSKSQIISCCYCWSVSLNGISDVRVDVFFKSQTSTVAFGMSPLLCVCFIPLLEFYIFCVWDWGIMENCHLCDKLLFSPIKLRKCSIWALHTIMLSHLGPFEISRVHLAEIQSGD